MVHVFISYSSKDHLEAERLARLLQERGYPVWWDHALESWDEYETQIRAALNAARVIVVIWSEGAAVSKWVYSEASTAATTRKLVNVRLPEFPVSGVRKPFDAYHIDVLDFAEPYRLLRSICSVWGGTLMSTKPLHECYSESFGVELFATKRASLRKKPSDAAPSELLQAPMEIVPYIDATRQLDGMRNWCLDEERATAGRLLHGPGGIGKSRLMIEVATQLRERGWLAGFLGFAKHSWDIKESQQREQALEQVFAFGPEPGVLLVVDYAEGRQRDVEMLARILRFRSRDTGPRVRIVLLSRGFGWWREVYQRNFDVATLFRKGINPLGDVMELDAIPEGNLRRVLFEKAVAAFRPIMTTMAASELFLEYNGSPPAPKRLAHIVNDKAFARPLAIQMEAMLHLASATPPEHGIDALLGAVLSLERRYWARIINGLCEGHHEYELRRAVAQVTCLGGMSAAAKAETLLMKDGYARREYPADVRTPLLNLMRAYGAPNGAILPLEPDLIGEHEVCETADDALVESCMAWIATLPEELRGEKKRTLLAVMQRATRPEHGEVSGNAMQRLQVLILRYLPCLADEIVDVLLESPGRLNEALSAAIQEVEEEALATFYEALPLQSILFMDLALVTTERLLSFARARLQAISDFEPLENRHALISQVAIKNAAFSFRLSNAGRHEDAAVAGRETVEMYRSLIEVDPYTFLPLLAKSLHNFGGMLLNIGQRKEALIATREALNIRRQLVQRHPETFLPILASSLTGLALLLSAVGQREEALSVSNEGIEIFRNLSAKRPDAFLPDLARGLSNSGVILSNLGRQEEALNATKEALDIHRTLANSRPDYFLPLLARSLNNFSADLSDAGKPDAALEAIQEASEIFRRLAESHPCTYMADLAHSLANLGMSLFNSGQGENGLSAAEEAVHIFQCLIKSGLQALSPDLAECLGTLGRIHLKTERYDLAAATFAEGLSAIASSVENHASAFHNLAHSLINDYTTACCAANISPDKSLLARIACALEAGDTQTPGDRHD